MEIVRENELSDKVIVLHGRIEVHLFYLAFAISVITIPSPFACT